MTATVSPEALKAELGDGQEISLLDVREHGQYGEGHPFYSVPCPYSQFEIRLPALVPKKSARVVLFDDDDGVAERAGKRARDLGYGNVRILDGGAPGWASAGFTLFKGVNVPSKTFGELLEEAKHTPRMSASDVAAFTKSGKPHVIVDGRPFSEYSKFNIPGGLCCPNGELALRIGEIAPDPDTTIIVNCAGRTRSILGAQTLIDFGIPNPVFALENGTQGWFLAGLELESGADRRRDDVTARDLAERQAMARTLMQANRIPAVDADTLGTWLADASRTTYVLDVRRREDYLNDGVCGTVHAPGGQLVQATDQWIGVRNARVVVLDSEMVRAPMVAHWLRQMGHEAFVLTGGVATAKSIEAQLVAHAPASAVPEPPKALSANSAFQDRDTFEFIDVRPSMKYRAGHIDGAAWSIRPRLTAVAANVQKPVVLIADDDGVAALATMDLLESGHSKVFRLIGSLQDWTSAGFDIVADGKPADGDCIDFLFFTHERHSGNEAAARQYLEWEVGLIAQMDDQERATFKL